MSVRDRIKLFEKSDSLTKPASISPPCKRTSGVSSSIRKVMSEIESKMSDSPKSPTFGDQGSFRLDKPVAHEAHAYGSPESFTRDPQTISTQRQSPEPCEFVSPACHVVEVEQGYYEMDEEFIESLKRMHLHASLNHSLILNKPLFPKPCMYTG